MKGEIGFQIDQWLPEKMEKCLISSQSDNRTEEDKLVSDNRVVPSSISTDREDQEFFPPRGTSVIKPSLPIWAAAKRNAKLNPSTSVSPASNHIHHERSPSCLDVPVFGCTSSMSGSVSPESHNNGSEPSSPKWGCDKSVKHSSPSPSSTSSHTDLTNSHQLHFNNLDFSPNIEQKMLGSNYGSPFTSNETSEQFPFSMKALEPELLSLSSKMMALPNPPANSPIHSFPATQPYQNFLSPSSHVWGNSNFLPPSIAPPPKASPVESGYSGLFETRSRDSGFDGQAHSPPSFSSCRSSSRSPLMNNFTSADVKFGSSLVFRTANELDSARVVFSRKVFVGGLPPDIDEHEITNSFRQFGPLLVDWPHKSESRSHFPPKGYAFILFRDENSVTQLLHKCFWERGKWYYVVSSPSTKSKNVQIRPWCLNDNECYFDPSSNINPRLTIFIGGVPRPLRASDLAALINDQFGNVTYAGIDVDAELKYPKGAGRVTFSDEKSYVSAIKSRFCFLQGSEHDKRVEIKPYVLDDQQCDHCGGVRNAAKPAPFFCPTELAYFCEICWKDHHSDPGKMDHNAVTKESSIDRTRPQAMRW